MIGLGIGLLVGLFLGACIALAGVKWMTLHLAYPPGHPPTNGWHR